MSKYLVKRVLLAILSILIVSAITFFVMNLIPGGPFNKEKATSKEAQQVLEERYNLDKPVPEQYVLYMNNLLHGDWGVSLHSGRNIGTEISRKFAVSAKLGGIAAIVAIIIGVILGSIAALTRNKLPDRLIVFFTTLGTAMPSFVLATLLLLVFCLKLGWIPVWSSSNPNYLLPIIALAAYPMAYIIAKFDESVQDILILLVTIPMWINTLLRTYAWISLLSDNGIVNSLLKVLGINPVTMMYTDFSVVMGLVCDLLPFMVIPIHTSLAKMDYSLVEAANDLGANRFQTFTKVIFKLSIPGVISGVTMVFLLSISSFVIPSLLGGRQYVLIGNLIENQFISVGDWNFGSAISIILAIIILGLIRLMKKIDSEEAGGE